MAGPELRLLEDEMGVGPPGEVRLHLIGAMSHNDGRRLRGERICYLEDAIAWSKPHGIERWIHPGTEERAHQHLLEHLRKAQLRKRKRHSRNPWNLMHDARPGFVGAARIESR